ncbi:MAG: hypothetical protein EBS00_00245 [Verrucomicrobia bacterium]|nr:hypothetical protein [Verrucomicrobiota bacterium]
MAMILLMVITLASFLSIEARLAAANQLRTQARMQALVSLRLALAHLQQEAGPDRRTTYRADMMRFSYSGSSSSPTSWTNARNPMWTGVQRTDRPFQLPAWIISGRGDMALGTNNPQMVSLAKPPPASVITLGYPHEFSPIAYDTNYWIPWETSYTGGTNANKIVLVGDATATTAEDQGSDPLSGRPDGRVSLPAVSLPDTNVSGRYCYWVGDEGVKANISLIDPRVQTSTATNSSVAVARRGLGRTGVELLTGFSNYQVGDIDSRIRSSDQLKLLSSSVFSDSTGNNAKALWPDVTLVSQGLFTDNKWGGLQIDLSTVFEKSDANFDASEFGQGTGSVEGTDGAVTFAFEEGQYNSSVVKDWQAFKNWKKPLVFNGSTINVAPVWTLMNRPYLGIAKNPATTAAVRGPTWYALRDYYLLYQQLSSGPQINARTHFPNAVAFAASSSNYPAALGFLHYSQMYNRSITPRTSYNGVTRATITQGTSNNYLDFKGYDRIYYYGPRGNSYNTTINNNVSGGSFLAPVPTKVSVAPYICRQLVAIGIVQNVGNVQLVVSPITVLHNPYNVKLNINGQRISFRNMDNWWLIYTRNYISGKENDFDAFNGVIPDKDGLTNKSQRRWCNDEGILSIIKQNNPNANKFQSLRFDIPSMTMEPGEFKIFSAGSTYSNYGGTLSNSYSTNTGFYGPCLAEYKTALPPTTPQPLSVARTDTSALYVQLWSNSYMPEGFKMVHQMISWPGDNLPSGNATSESFYNTCSIVTELTVSPGRSASYGLSSNINGAEPTRRQILSASLPSLGEQPLLLGVFDYDMRWANDPSPFTLFVRTNPLAASRRVDGSDATWDPGLDLTLDPGPHFLGTQYYSSTSPSFKFGVRDVTNFTGLVDTSGSNAFGGMSNTSLRNGTTSAVFTEVPLSAPLSIAQFTHANYGLFDHDPLYQIGNSLYPTFGNNAMYYVMGAESPAGSAPFSQPPSIPAGEATYFDGSVIINRALFDKFFLSSISPVYTNGVETKSQASVIDDFIDGVSPLANPRIKLVSIDKETARTELKDQTKNHRKVAKHIANEGAFNIHSMSVRAWAAVLAGAKAKALSNETGDSSTNARFPRVVRADSVSTSGVNQAPYSNASAWTGLTNLTDNQIKLLARSIVRENMWRMSYSHRDSIFGIIGSALGHGAHRNGTFGGTLVTIRDLPTYNAPSGILASPFLGLSQFVNRNFCDNPEVRIRCGALQSAITGADKDGAQLTNRNATGIPDTVLDFNGTTYSVKPPPPFVRDGQGVYNRRASNNLYYEAGPITWGTGVQNYADVKLGAPTSLLQSDILAAIGTSLTTRSDTFTIRAYGDVSDKPGGPAAGTCWVEAVVQRLPEFIDNSQASDTAVGNSTNSFGHNTSLLPVNINLGRRFVIVSMRILKPNEL